MRKSIYAGLAVVAVAAPIALAATPANAAGLANLGFEDGTNIVLTSIGDMQVSGTSAALPGWTVEKEVDLVHSSLWQAADGSYSIDLIGSNGVPEDGAISQTFDTTPGTKYTVTFKMSGNPDEWPSDGPREEKGLKTMSVVAANGSDVLKTETYEYNTATAGNTRENMLYVPKTFTFDAVSAQTALTFRSTTSATGGSQWYGPVIDDIGFAAQPPVNVVKARVWHTWTGGPTATAPAIDNPAWHANNGDPQSKTHKVENHTIGVPYYVANNGPKGGGSWFLWLEV